MTNRSIDSAGRFQGTHGPASSRAFGRRLLLALTGLAGLAFGTAQAGPLSTITVGNDDPDRVTTDANSPSIANCSFQEAVFIATSDPAQQESNDCRISPLGGPPPYVIDFTSAFTIQPDDMPTIDEDIIIEGPVTLDGTDQSPLFTVSSDTSLTLDAAGSPLLLIVENCTSSCIIASSPTSTVNALGVLFQDNNTTSDGGAIRAGGALNVAGSTFLSNSADGDGGAIDFSGSSLTITGSIFGGPLLGNTAAGNGGALYLATSASTSSWSITGSAFIDNSSTNAGGSQGGNGGGAIFANNASNVSSFSIVATEFLDNSAPNGTGGAIAFGLSNQIGFSVGASTIADLSAGGIFASHFNGNTAGGPAGPGGAGGAIHNRGDEMAIVATSFENNSSTNASGGAIAENGGGDSVLVNVTMNNNTAATDGGAIVQLGGFGSLDMINSTIAGNSAGNEGGGIWNTSNSFTATNSIVANNTADPMGTNPGANCGGPDALINGGNNLQSDAGMDTTVCGGGTPFATGDPDLSAFQYNGGVHLLVETMEPGPNSAAHGAGNDSVCSSFPVLGLDARDVIPVRPDPGGSSCDIGAFESDLGPAAIDLAPDAGLNFMGVVVGQNSSLQATLTNTGDLSANNVQLTPSGGDFLLMNDTCSGGPLAGMASCTVDVVFAPATAGAQSQTLAAMADGGLMDSIGLDGTGQNPATLDLLPDAGLDFMMVETGMSSTLTATLSNAGDVPATGLVLSFSGGDFSLTNDTCGGSVPASGSCTVDVVFSPTADGAQSETLAAMADGGLMDSINVTGTGFAPSALVITPNPIDFMMVETGQTATIAVTVENTGGQTTGALSQMISGGEFSVQADTCTGATLPAAGVCTLDVQFAPTADGAQNEMFTVTDGGTASDTVALTGTGFTAAGLEITPDPIDFMMVETGQTATLGVTVTNTGGQTTGMLSLMISGGEFSVQADTCTGATLPAAGVCTLDIEFAPTADGAQNETFMVDDGGGASDMVALTGTGFTPSALVITPDPIDFMMVQTGQTSTIAVTIDNTGGQATGALALTISGGEFTAQNDTCTGNTLPAAGSCTLDIQFAPTADGPQNETFTAGDGGSATDMVALTGTGFTPAGLDIQPDPIDFMQVETGQTATIVVTVSNTGSQTTGALTLMVSGGEFTLLNDLCSGTTLGAAATCTVDVQFAPTTDGAQNETLMVTDGATAMDSTALIGTGFTPAAVLELTPDPVAFGTVITGTSSTIQATISNTGTLDAANLALSVSGGDFTLLNDTCPATLMVAASCTVDIEFAPLADGPQTETLTASADGGVTSAIDLTGTGIPPLPDPGDILPIPVNDPRGLLLLMVLVLSVGALTIRQRIA